MTRKGRSASHKPVKVVVLSGDSKGPKVSLMPVSSNPDKPVTREQQRERAALHEDNAAWAADFAKSLTEN
jgi:hypothetical protein